MVLCNIITVMRFAKRFSRLLTNKFPLSFGKAATRILSYLQSPESNTNLSHYQGESLITMFENLKNRIKEETGSDINLIPSLASANQTKLLGKGKHSRSGSTTSLSSFTIDGNKEEPASSPSLDIKLADGKVVTPKEFKKLESKEEEWRRKLQKKEEEFATKLKKTEELWKKQLEEKEKEFKKVIDKKESEKKAIEEEKNGLKMKNQLLEESAKKAADYQKKVCQYQEDIDQLEGFQTQEMAKIKHLLLVAEQEVAEKDKLLKESNLQMETLKAELVKLRKFEKEYGSFQDELETMRHAFDKEKTQLSSDLAQKEEDVRHLKDRVAILEQRLLAGSIPNGAELTVNDQVQALLAERALMERRLEEAHLYLSEIKSNWSNTIAYLETQVERLCRQASEESAERRQAELDRDATQVKVTELTEEVEKLQSKLETKNTKIERLMKEKENLEEDLKLLKLKTEEDMKNLREEIKTSTENVKSLEEKLKENRNKLEVNVIESRELTKKLEEEKNAKYKLQKDYDKMKEAAEVEKKINEEISVALEKERRDKDEMMMRNAEISQEVELAKQGMRKQEMETAEFQSKIVTLEKKLAEKEKEIETVFHEKNGLLSRIHELEKLEAEKELASSVEKDLKTRITQLENELFDKNKSIKMLQQRLSDMKKTLQRELKVPITTIDPGGAENDGFISPYASSTSAGTNTAVITPSSSHQMNVSSRYRGDDVDEDVNDDVNFKYLKHVLMKFLTSREYEAKHLTRAVATLLRFSEEEERLLNETLEWKMSWFGTKPNLGNGQTAKTIPPS